MGHRPSLFSTDWLVLHLCRRWVVWALDRYAGGRFLDVGCGGQPYRAEQSFHCTRWMGVEPDRERYAGVRPTVWGSGLDLPFLDRSFDTVFSSQVLEHVPEPGRMVGEMGRVLRPGGYLILTAPHMWGVHEEPRDYFRFTPFGLAYLARRAGLEPVSVHAMAGYWVTAGARFCCYLGRLERHRLALLAWAACAPVQLVSWALDRLRRVDGDAWNHLMIARKREAGGD